MTSKVWELNGGLPPEVAYAIDDIVLKVGLKVVDVMHYIVSTGFETAEATTVRNYLGATIMKDDPLAEVIRMESAEFMKFWELMSCYNEQVTINRLIKEHQEASDNAENKRFSEQYRNYQVGIAEGLRRTLDRLGYKVLGITVFKEESHEK